MRSLQSSLKSNSNNSTILPQTQLLSKAAVNCRGHACHLMGPCLDVKSLENQASCRAHTLSIAGEDEEIDDALIYPGFMPTI